MPNPLQFAGQAAVFAMAALFAGYFSAAPVYRQVPEGMAQIKLSFRHAGARLADCRKLTPGEIAKLPANERRPNTCTRERIAIAVDIRLDGRPLYAEILQPTGLPRDGPAETYAKFIVPAGPHRIEARLRDSRRAAGFDFETVRDIDLAPFQNLAVDFKSDRGGFLFR